MIQPTIVSWTKVEPGDLLRLVSGWNATCFFHPGKIFMVLTITNFNRSSNSSLWGRAFEFLDGENIIRGRWTVSDYNRFVNGVVYR